MFSLSANFGKVLNTADVTDGMENMTTLLPKPMPKSPIIYDLFSPFVLLAVFVGYLAADNFIHPGIDNWGGLMGTLELIWAGVILAIHSVMRYFIKDARLVYIIQFTLVVVVGILLLVSWIVGWRGK